MSFDEEDLDQHGECRQEIRNLRATIALCDARIARLEAALVEAKAALDDANWSVRAALRELKVPLNKIEPPLPSSTLFKCRAAIAAVSSALADKEQGRLTMGDEKKAAIIAKLTRSMTTAANDDYSKPGTRERERHCARLEAMADAVEYLRAKTEAHNEIDAEKSA